MSAISNIITKSSTAPTNGEEKKKKKRNRKRIPAIKQNLPEFQVPKDDAFDDDSTSSSSEEEDEEGELLTPLVEDQFLRVIPMIINKNPAIYDSSKKFFAGLEEKGNDEENNGTSENKEQKKKKPIYLRDYLREQLLRKDAQGSISDSDTDDENDEAKVDDSETYQETQDKLKEAFKIKLAEEEAEKGLNGDDDFLTLRKKTRKELKREEREFQEFEKEVATREREKQIRLLQAQPGKDPMNILTSYWNNANLDENEKFLRNYILNEGWKEKKVELPSYEEVVADIDQDDDTLDAQDNFEAKYNFRFEEAGAETIVSYPRNVESSRISDDSRKQKRKEKEEKKRLEKVHKEEELKRLKNIKKKEIMDQLKKIQEISGSSSLPGFTEEDLEEDFDPDKFSQQMAAIYNDDYYGTADEKYPNNPREDEILSEILADDTKEVHSSKEKRKSKKEKKEEKSEDEFYDNSEFNHDSTSKNVDKLIEEYFNLDYEDLIGDIPCRFKYEKVEPNDYGLNTDEILEIDDKDLNSFVSLKKLYPYRGFEWHADKRKRNKLRTQLRELKQAEKEKTTQEHKSEKRKRAKSPKKKEEDEVVKSEKNKDIPDELEMPVRKKHKKHKKDKTKKKKKKLN